MSEVPRLNLDELLLEISLTTKRHIIVEGPTDRRFFRAWADDLDARDRVVVTSVEDIEIDTDWLFEVGLNDGNRSLVLLVAHRASSITSNVRCIADRDCGHGIDAFDYEVLMWTDFPALESYAIDAAVMDRANLLSFAGRLPSAAILLPPLGFALRELFAVRAKHEHLPRPKYDAGFKNKTRRFEDFRVELTVDVSIRSETPSYPRPQSTDPREHAYGHDVAELLLAVHGNALKNQAGLATREAVEGALRSAMQVVGTYKSERLFRELEAWIAA